MVSSIACLDSLCFHDELVSLLLRSALDRKEAERAAVIVLLHALVKEAQLSHAQLVRGFEKLVLSWEDMRLDIPDVANWLVGLLSSRAGIFDKCLFLRLPEELLRAVCGDLPSGGVVHEAMRQHVEELARFKAMVASQLQDLSGVAHSAGALAEWLRAADEADFHHEVVLAACLCAVRAPPGEEAALRQRAALSALAGLRDGHVLSDVDLQLGFSRLLGRAAELAAQGSGQEAVVGLLRGAVEQELLPAEFLKCARRLRFGGPLGVRALREAQRRTPAHSRRVWGSGDARQIRMEVKDAILEYFDSNNAEELGRIVEELHLSGKEVVKFVRKLLTIGMENGKSELALDAIAELQGFFWSTEDVRTAFDQLADIADDLVLDFPHCRERTQTLVQTAQSRGLLEESYLVSSGIAVV